MTRQYSSDRESLALEIRDTLRIHGHWVPDNAGPDMITAVGVALNKIHTEVETLRDQLVNEKKAWAKLREERNEWYHKFYESHEPARAWLQKRQESLAKVAREKNPDRRLIAQINLKGDSNLEAAEILEKIARSA